jgi:hypothetical protein
VRNVDYPFETHLPRAAGGRQGLYHNRIKLPVYWTNSKMSAMGVAGIAAALGTNLSGI